nr:PREDICTED: putative killer cell immunoglobulin-like receptor-like protein KIR3DX1 [Equus przewalskii]
MSPKFLSLLGLVSEVGRGFAWKLTLCFFPGVFTKPSISAHPGSLAHAGGTVTLRCHSELVFDTFILLKEGNTGHSQQFVEDLPDGYTQAHFSTGPVMSAHVAPTDALSHSPNECSAARDPCGHVVHRIS